METISWVNGRIRLLDQSRLPFEETYLELADYRDLATAVEEMRIRGAPALGLAAAYGLALAARQSSAGDRQTLVRDLKEAAQALRATRPTAANLAWALQHVLSAVESAPSIEAAQEAALAEARRIHEEDVAANRRIGELGAALLPDGVRVLTHCNAGALATGGYGTALGVIRSAHEQGKRPHLYVDETRPLLQGARLTAWEAERLGLATTLIVDSAAGGLMQRGLVDCVIVGADRVAANGDVANKVGTYALAVLANENGLPFYVAAPVSTIDLSLTDGDQIPIEERRPEEVTEVAGRRVAPEGIAAMNPAFDVTPHKYISAIITELGVVREPYRKELTRLLQTPASVSSGPE